MTDLCHKCDKRPATRDGILCEACRTTEAWEPRRRILTRTVAGVAAATLAFGFTATPASAHGPTVNASGDYCGTHRGEVLHNGVFVRFVAHNFRGRATGWNHTIVERIITSIPRPGRDGARVVERTRSVRCG